MNHIAVDSGGIKIEIILSRNNILDFVERKRVPNDANCFALSEALKGL